MSENVVNLRSEIAAENDRRAGFLDAVAQSYDLYVKDFGEDPDALVYIYAGLKQSARVAWSVQGDSRGGVTSVQSLACMALHREINNPA